MQQLSVALDLNQNDNIDVYISSGKLQDDTQNHYTHFSGYLLKGEVVFGAYSDTNKGASTLPLHYSGTTVNVENGFDSSTGIFTAQISGIYAFHFTALSDNGNSNHIKLMHNDNQVAGAFQIVPTVSKVHG